MNHADDHHDPANDRRHRLGQLLDLAQNYRGWTRKQLSAELGRDPTKLVPGSGVPKLDVIIALAKTLDRTLDDVVAHLWLDEATISEPNFEGDFEALDAAAQAAHRAGRFHDMIALAEQAYEAASNDEERARACNRRCGGWDGMGRATDALEAIQDGLRLSAVSPERRRMMQSNLANAYYSLWRVLEARSIAADLLEWYEARPPQTIRDRKTEAFAYYVRGHASRRSLTAEPDLAPVHAVRAKRDLSAAIDRYEQLALEMGDASYSGIAATCRGGLLEVEALCGDLDPKRALERFQEGLADLDDTPGDRLESVGWWCVFGCNVALRTIEDESFLQRSMAIFTMKGEEIADRLDSWPLRERLFTAEHSHRVRGRQGDAFSPPMLIDDLDIRTITGTMARFPNFRATGWSILQEADVVAKDGGR